MRFTSSSCRGRLMAAVLLVVLASAGCMRTPEQKSARFVEEGKKLLAKKDPARAILEFRNAAQATPRNAEVYYQLALAFQEAGDFKQGVAALRRTLELDPKHRGAQLRLAQLMAVTNDPGVLKDAQERLKALIEEAPRDPDALHALGLTELKLGDSTDAMEHLALAAAAAPQELRISVTMAQAKLQQRDPK